MNWKLKNALFRLTHPSFWIQNKPTCWELDKKIRAAMLKGEFVLKSPYTASLGGVELWVANYPHCFGFVYGLEKMGLPAPLTRVELRKMMIEAVFNKGGHA